VENDGGWIELAIFAGDIHFTLVGHSRDNESRELPEDLGVLELTGEDDAGVRQQAVVLLRAPSLRDIDERRDGRDDIPRAVAHGSRASQGHEPAAVRPHDMDLLVDHGFAVLDGPRERPLGRLVGPPIGVKSTPVVNVLEGLPQELARARCTE
jgi:hypothetical protein